MDTLSVGQQPVSNVYDTSKSHLTGVLVNTINEIVELVKSCDNYTNILQTYGRLRKQSFALNSLSKTSNHDSCDLDELDSHLLASNPEILRNINSLLGILTIFNELADHLKLIPISIVSKLLRCIHCLNGDYSKDTLEECRLLSKCWYNVVYITLMDLLFCLLRLEKVIESMWQVGNSLRVMKKVCTVVVDYPVDKRNEEFIKLNQLTKEKLPKLFDTIDSIQSALFIDKTVLQKFFINFRLLIQDQTLNSTRSATITGLLRTFESFLSFHAAEMIDSNLKTSSLKPNNYVISNLAQTLYMVTPQKRLLGISLIFLLYCCTFDKLQNSVIKSIINTLYKFKPMNPVFLDNSDQTVVIGELLTKYLPKTLLNSHIKTIRSLSSIPENASVMEKFEHFMCQGLSWQMQFKALFLDRKKDKLIDTRKMLETQLMNLKSAIKLANEINEALGTYIVSTNHLNFSMEVLQLVALVKSIEVSFKNAQDSVSKVLMSRDELMKEDLDKLTCGLKERVMSIGSTFLSTDQKEYSSSTLFMATSSISRLTPMQFDTTDQENLFCLLELIQILCPKDLRQLKETLSLVTGNIKIKLERATSCSHIFWCLPSLSTFYRWSLEEDPCAIKELYYIHMALDDMKKLFAWNEDVETEELNILSIGREEFFVDLEEELFEQFKSNFLDRISQELETELRLQVHRNLQLPDTTNSFKRRVYNLKHIFDLTDDCCRNFRVLGKQISMCSYVEEYLNRIFSQLATITPYDKFTYDSMIHLAKCRYGLQLDELELLNVCTEGAPLELTDVALNFGSFVAKYAYDHTLRRFIEKCPSSSSRWSGGCSSISTHHLLDNENSTLNVLQLENVHRFIQTYGFEGINGPVNRSYQLLKKLLGLISRQVSDERIKVALGKEESSLRVDNVINFERASALTNLFIEASSLGPTTRATNHLDALRISITQLGNVVAFVGLLRIGLLRCAASNLRHLPSVFRTRSTATIRPLILSSTTAVHPAVCEAATNLDECLASIQHQSSPTTDYLQSMVHIFSASLQQQSHLATFFLLIPSLSIQYISHLTGCKERLEARTSSARAGGQLCDDGFPLGVAFLLIALNQRHLFDKLQWFEQVNKRMQRERLQLEQRAQNKSSRDESLKQTALMSLRRINKLASEYETLNYTLTTALFSFSTSLNVPTSECPPPAP